MEEEQKPQNGNEENTAGANAPVEAADPGAPAAETQEDTDAGEKLREELNEANARVEQLERERFLLLQGVPEEDLDYCVFRIGKLVGAEKDFRTAAKEFLKRYEAAHGGRGFRSGASLSGRSPKTQPSANETMNQLLRASR